TEVSYQFDDPGDFEVRLITSSDFGCRDTLSQSLTVNGTPTSSFLAETVCVGDPTFFQADPDESLSGPVNQFLWQFGSATSIFEATTFTFPSPGPFEVNLTVTSDLGCADDTIVVVFVSDDPTVGFTYGPACVGQSVQFTDTSLVFEGDNIAEWNWFFANVDESGLQSPAYTFEFPGVYDVSLNIETSAGCSAQWEEQVEVSPLPLSSFTVVPNIGSPPLTPVLDNNSQGGEEFLWQFDLGQTSIDSLPIHTFTDSGLVIIDLTVINSEGCIDISSQPLFLTEPLIDLVLLDVDYEIMDGFLRPTLSIRNLGNFDLEEFIIEVDVTEGSFIQEFWTGLLPRNASVIYPMSSNINISDDGSLPFFCIRLVPSQLRVDIDESNNEICTEIGNAGDEVFFIAPNPNPTSDRLNFTLVNAGSSDIESEVFDHFGRVVDSEIFSSDGTLVQNFELDLSHLVPARYILRVSHGVRTEVYKIQVLRD
ncbi:MAG: PKD domain-containing protein, partial [Flavobacteriales bacterium]|nr:PKD domain-containing protein [Flavobacteriales bacterium]